MSILTMILIGWAAMPVFLLKITGIPMTEERSLKSRGDAYRAYRQTTNKFVPGPPKTGGDTKTRIAT